MSNYLFINQEKSAELLVPLTPVDYNLQAQNDRLIYVPLATRDNFGAVKIGEGLTIEHGLLSFDRKELDVKLSTNVGSENAGKFLYVSDTGNIVFVDQVQTITKISELENDVGYITKDFINDFGFITNTVDNLVNYYLKTEQYTKEEINELVSKIPKFDVEIVDDPDTIPEEERSETTIYLVPRTDGELNDYYDEIIWIHNTWERLGSTKINLSNYYTKTDADKLFLSKTDANSTFAKISDIPDVSNFATKDELPDLDDFDLSEYAKKTDIPDITNLATKNEIPDISNLANRADIPTKISELENDSGFLDSIPSEYITESELNDKNYATKGEIPTNLSQLQNDSGFITAAEVPEGSILYDTIGQNTDGSMSQAASTNAFALKSEIPDTSGFITNTVNNLTNYYTKDQVDAALPIVNNSTLTIQKNGTNIATFSANQSGDATANIIIPTTASDVSALPNTTKYGASLSLSMNTSTYVVTVQLKDQDGNNLGTAQTIDLPLESVVVSGAYNNTTKKVVLTLKDGSTVDFSVADLIDGLVSQTSFSELENEVSNNTQNINNVANSRYTKAEVNNLIKDFITKEVNNLTNYYTSAQIDAKGYLTSVPSNYVTESELGITLNGYAHTSSVDDAFTLISDLRTDLTALEETVEGLAGASDLSSRVRTLEENTELINQQVNENYEKILEIDRDYVRTSTWSTLSTNVSTNTSDIITLKAAVKNIPTKVGELGNDVGFITRSDVPSKTSQLTNDSGFITLSSIPDTSKMVLTDTTQTISGAKTFTGSIIVPDVTIS